MVEPWFQRSLKLNDDELLSKCAFNVNLRHYIKVVKAKDIETAAATAHTHRVHGPPDGSRRVALFGAYLFGCLVILLASLAPHAD